MAKKPSPAQLHLQRFHARASIVAAPSGPVAAEYPEDGPEASAYALLREQLGEHLAELKNTAGTEAKIAKKLEFLPIYADHIKTVLLASETEGKALQDIILVQVMIWTFDAATTNPDLYVDAFTLADHVLKYGLTLPERFNRSPAALIAEFVADDAAQKIGLASPDVISPFGLDLLKRAFDIIEGRSDVVDQIPAKLHKCAGYIYMRLAAAIADGRETGPAGGLKAAQSEALTHFKRAFALQTNIGVKKEIQALEKALSKNAE